MHVPKQDKAMIDVALCTIYAQLDCQTVKQSLTEKEVKRRTNVVGVFPNQYGNR
jgi:hypothetical protein